MLEITEKEFIQLAEFIKANYGIYLKKDKMALVSGRLQNLLVKKGYKNFTDYYQSLLSDKNGSEIVNLINRITTNHTFFMRESDHFYYFRDQVMPYLKAAIKDRDLRIWSAGCSTGEEAYTLAMFIGDFFGNEKIWWNTKVLATDISQSVLTIAKKGIYSNEQIAPLPPQWKINYFKQQDPNNYALLDKIMNEVIFRSFNLMDPVFPFKKRFHTIFCRNVMIYFDNETKMELVNKFYNHLEYGGYLFLGHSESIDRSMSKFRYIMPAVYRKE